MSKYLVVVDMQNDFVTGSLGTKEAQAIIPAAASRIRECAAAKGWVILGTLDTHGQDYPDTLEGRLLPVVHCVRDTPGHALHPDIQAAVPNPDIFCPKSTFGSVELAMGMLMTEASQADRIESIEIIGLCTDICVLANALLLRTFFPNVPICVRASCCAGTTPEKHEAALDVMKSCQIEVIR